MFQLDKRHQLVLLAIAAIILFGIGYRYAEFRQPPKEPDLVVDEPAAGEEQPQEPTELVVHVAGAVQKPGVYRLPPGSRVVDAVNMAGVTEDSALNYLNLAAPLEDGKQIMIASLKELQSQPSPASAANSPAVGSSQSVSGFAATTVPAAPGASRGGLININTASATELQQLSGIGPSLSQRIIDYRQKNGPFLSVEDIMGVSGIGEKRFEQIKDSICVN